MNKYKLAPVILAASSAVLLSACGTSTTSAPVSHTTTAPSKSVAPKASAPASHKPHLSASQEQALVAAKGYLALDSGFSRLGLINQLTSHYGNGFPVADATNAVDSLNIDYNAQAVLAAKGYLSLGTGFSHAGLVQQLDSAYGNKFTPAQAEYAATHVGL